MKVESNEITEDRQTCWVEISDILKKNPNKLEEKIEMSVENGILSIWERENNW